MALLEETEILNRYTSGDLTGIYITPTCFYIPIRWTGTGRNIRFNGENYYISDRPKEVFSLPELLKAVNGLPILLDHPSVETDKGDKKSETLNFQTLKDNPIIGITTSAFVKGEDVWTIGRIYDLSLLSKFENEIFSTSPCVSSVEIPTTEGTLVERPLAFNHLAFVYKGHWDTTSSQKAIDDSVIAFSPDLKKQLQKIQKEGEIMAETDKIGTEEASNKTDDALVAEPSNQLKELEARVAKLEQVEKEEASNFGELSEEHETIKPDESEPAQGLDQTQTQNKETDMAEEITKETKVDEAKVEETKADENVAAEEAKEKQAEENAAAEDIKAKIAEEKTDSEDKDTKTDSEDKDTTKSDSIISDAEPLGEDDKNRDEIIETMTNLADSLDSSIGFRKVYVGQREKPAHLIQRIFKANKSLIPKAYEGLIKSDSFLSGGSELAQKAFDDMYIELLVKNDEIQGTKKSLKTGGYDRVSQYLRVDRDF